MPRPILNRQRIIDHGEVFTPPHLVSDMLNLIAHECERIDSRFLEPACGNGNFLAEVLRRKLHTVDQNHASDRSKWERDAILCVCSIYGIDLLPDNVSACRERMLGVLSDAHNERFGMPLPDSAKVAAAHILTRNVVQGDALTLRNAQGKPIVFSEWSLVNSVMLKRRDFKFAHLIGHAEDHARLADTPLFSDLGEEVYVPEPIGDRPLCHYLKVAQLDQSEEAAS